MIVDFLFTYPRPWLLVIGLPLAFVAAWVALGMSIWLALAGLVAFPVWLIALWCLRFIYAARPMRYDPE